MKWTPDFIIALVLIVSCVALIATGIDSEVKSILTLASGWAFGSQFQRRRLEKEGK
jgi:uncharacterized membrane protein AbrB (regulator of aidB expression)